MLTKLWTALDGYKTYTLAALGILIALTGHFWGPYNLAGQTIPQFTWPQVWDTIWTSGLFSALHAQK